MQQKARDRFSDTDRSSTIDQDSPTIRNLIEQLNRDLEESQQSASELE